MSSWSIDSRHGVQSPIEMKCPRCGSSGSQKYLGCQQKSRVKHLRHGSNVSSGLLGPLGWHKTHLGKTRCPGWSRKGSPKYLGCWAVVSGLGESLGSSTNLQDVPRWAGLINPTLGCKEILGCLGDSGHLCKHNWACRQPCLLLSSQVLQRLFICGWLCRHSYRLTPKGTVEKLPWDPKVPLVKW